MPLPCPPLECIPARDCGSRRSVIDLHDPKIPESKLCISIHAIPKPPVRSGDAAGLHCSADVSGAALDCGIVVDCACYRTDQLFDRLSDPVKPVLDIGEACPGPFDADPAPAPESDKIA